MMVLYYEKFVTQLFFVSLYKKLGSYLLFTHLLHVAFDCYAPDDLVDSAFVFRMFEHKSNWNVLICPLCAKQSHINQR